MVDIATIGFGADTSGLVKAETALNRLAPAAQKAETAAANVAGALTAASQAGTKVTLAANGVTISTNAAAKSYTAATGAIAANTNAAKASVTANNNVAKSVKGVSYEAKNLSFQLVDVTQGLVGGQPIFQIFAQQAGQIGQVIATSPGGLGGLMKELGGAVARVLTPVRLLTLGFIGAAAGVTAFAISTINSAKQMDELGKSTGFAQKELHQLQQLTSAKGVSKDDFSAGMKSFSEQVYQAKQNTGELNGLLIANGQTAKTNVEYFMRVADLVARTSDEVQKRKILEAAGLPTTRAWVDLMSQGSKAIKAAADATVDFNLEAEANLVKKARDFDDAWNSAWTRFGNNAKSAIVSALGFLDKLQAGATSFGNSKFWDRFVPNGSKPEDFGLKSISNFEQRFQQGDKPSNSTLLENGLNKRASELRGPDPKTQAQRLLENQQAQQRIALLGEMATVEDKVKQKELELAAAGLQGVGVNKQQQAAILNAVRAQEEMNRVNQQAALGIFNLKDAQKAAADTLQMWIDKKIVDKNSTEQMAAATLVLKRNIDEVRDAAAVAAAPLQGLKRLEIDASNFGKQLDGTITNSLNGLINPIQDVLNGVTSLSDGFKNAGIVILKAIQEMIIKMLILAPIAKGLQAILGGFGGGSFATDGIGGFGPTAPAAKGAYFGANDNVSRFAKGGAFTNRIVNKPTAFSFANGSMFGEMGEAGPEAIMPLKRGPGGSLGVQMYGGKGGGGSGGQIMYAPQITLGGTATQDDLNNLRKLLLEDRKQFVNRVANAIPQIRKRGGGI